MFQINKWERQIKADMSKKEVDCKNLKEQIGSQWIPQWQLYEYGAFIYQIQSTNHQGWVAQSQEGYSNREPSAL